MGKHSTQFNKGRAVEMLKSGRSIRHVAKCFKVSVGAVHKWKKTYNMIGNVERKRGSGRKCNLSPRIKRRIVRWLVTEKCETATDIKRLLQNEENIVVSRQTVSRALKTMGMRAVTKKKKPYLSEDHKKQRLKFAREHKDWTAADWRNVMFSDETKVNLHGSDGIRYAWKRPEDPIDGRTMIRTKKFGGGSIMIWSCIGYR